uniref:NADH-ubiquinone oxidoreductase chain 3 n=1 Tax=Amphiura digitula TaxID=2588555 RepID=A0A4Y5T2K2_9ECHI|nr:NADH dehydrogenase subunit 3 [Amphiura digitula]QDA81582.1 NADH dehydrogenase subunit 3 [Amphiura digitula]QHT54240.1 NADH dehydrogenase subunit 3 [Amphiura digitula]
MWNSFLFLYIVLISLLALVMVILGRILAPNLPYVEKMAPYECGFDPINSARLPFSFRFFLVAILFLIFDLEIALLLVLPFSFCIVSPLTSSYILTIFLIILSFGLYYEWANGGLDWASD